MYFIYWENLNKFKVQKIKAPGHLNRKDLRLTVDNPEDLVICRKIYNEFSHQAPRIDLEEVIVFRQKFISEDLVYPFTIQGYETMYK